jgi:hypothetical protein
LHLDVGMQFRDQVCCNPLVERKRTECCQGEYHR